MYLYRFLQPKRTVYATCPECGNPGPHRSMWSDHCRLGDGWVECGNYYRYRIDDKRWAICGATWQSAADEPAGRAA